MPNFPFTVTARKWSRVEPHRGGEPGFACARVKLPSCAPASVQHGGGQKRIGGDMQAYSDQERESDPYALPDVEVFYMSGKQMRSYGKDSVWYLEEDRCYMKPGFYYWYCFPGCLPDSEPCGPFTSERAALADAREGGEG
jgi:hypothetical protein